MPPRRASAIVAAALCACLAGCASKGTGERPSRTQATSVPADARAAVTIGKSTKADVIAALGKTVAIAFDSGYEVWVYHIKGDTALPPGTAEFVLLFDPTGVVTKTRVRPAPALNSSSAPPP